MISHLHDNRNMHGLLLLLQRIPFSWFEVITVFSGLHLTLSKQTSIHAVRLSINFFIVFIIFVVMLLDFLFYFFLLFKCVCYSVKNVRQIYEINQHCMANNIFVLVLINKNDTSWAIWNKSTEIKRCMV